MNRALMSDMVRYLLENSRKLTKEEAEAHSKLLASQSKIVKNLYDLGEQA